jgi:CspA family cold shock protein
MADGIVKWFNEKKGYGFIRQDDGQEVFVHHSGINATGFRTLAEGARVTFEVEQGPKGPSAVNVTVVA